MLSDCEEVGQDLAGMGLVREAVDDRDGGVAGELFQIPLREGPDEDGVHVAGKDTGCVGEGLPASDLDVLGVEIEGVPPKLEHGHLERNPGPRRGFIEDHPKRFSQKRLVGLSQPMALSELPGLLEEALNLSRFEAPDGKKMLHVRRDSNRPAIEGRHFITKTSQRESFS